MHVSHITLYDLNVLQEKKKDVQVSNMLVMKILS
jgi:hypothetical protein